MARWLLVSIVVVGGCQEKMNAEKLADQAASAKASASAVASASASVKDPNEEKFAKARKDVKDRATAHMTALQKLYTGVPEAERVAFRQFFPKTKEGEKVADELSKEAVFVGKEGMSIRKWEIEDVDVKGGADEGTTGVFQEETQRGKTRCTRFKLVWKLEAATWVRSDRIKFEVVPCP